MKRIWSFLLVCFLVLSVVPNTGYATDNYDPTTFRGIALRAARDVTINLYTGYTGGKNVTPVHKVTTDSEKIYYFQVEAGNYRAITQGNGYYRYEKNIHMSAAKVNAYNEYEVTPDKRYNTGKEAGNWEEYKIQQYTDEVLAMDAFNDDISQWPEYADVFTTPWFTQDHGAQQQTTQAQMEEFIFGLDDANDNMYVFSIGKSAYYEHDVWAVLFSEEDLSSAKTIDEAVKLLDQEKLNVLYRGQIHGFEPAACEGALALIQRLDGQYGDKLTHQMNICIVPRANPDGAQDYERNLHSGLEPNADSILARSQELTDFIHLYNLMVPEVSIDAHEYSSYSYETNFYDSDVLVGGGFSPANSEEFAQVNTDMVLNTFGVLGDHGLSYRYYENGINKKSPTVYRGYAGKRSAFSFLLETRGNTSGTVIYPRRVVSQVIATEAILDYSYDNLDTVKRVAREDRATIIEKGKTYREDDVVILETGAVEVPELTFQLKRIYQSGTIQNRTLTPEVYSQVLRSRVAPTAYVIPAGESYTAQVLSVMDKQDISYSLIPAGSTVCLQQYTGSTDEAGLTEEQFVTFPQGAYVFTMDQANSVILYLLMEPDTKDGGISTGFARYGTIEPADGKFPIYRYCFDLNEDGFIGYTVGSLQQDCAAHDYQKRIKIPTAEQAGYSTYLCSACGHMYQGDHTVIPAAPEGLSGTEITVVGGLGMITGLDPEKAYEYRSADATGYVPVADGATQIRELPAGVYHVRYRGGGDTAPSADAIVRITCVFAVYLDSANGSDQQDAYTKETAAATFNYAQQQLDQLMTDAPAGTTGEIRILGNYAIMGAQTLPKHSYPLQITGGTLTFTATESQKYLRMGGDTTFDDITLKMGSSNGFYFLCGDGHKLTIGANVTTPAYSGNYFNLMGGSGAYSNSTYVAKSDLTVLSGTWKYVFAGGYVSSVTGDVRATLKDCSVERVAPTHNGTIEGDVYCSLENVTIRENVLYCGNIQKNNINGDVTFTLGEGVQVSNVYAGSKVAGNIGGTVTVVANGVDLTNTTLYGKAKNTTGTIGGLALVLNQGQLSQAVNSFVTRDGVSVKLGCDQTESFTLPYDITLDLNGCNVAAVDTAGHTLHVFDSKTDDYVGDDYGTIPADASYAAAENYLAVTENGKVSFHKYTLQIRRVTLKNSMVGLSYQCLIAGDEKVKSQVAEFGVAMRVGEPVTGAQIREDTENRIHVVRDGSVWRTGSQGQRLTSVAVKDIMKPGESNESNAQGAETKVYGSAYMLLKDGTYILGDAEGRSLREVAELADGIYDTLNETQIQAFRTLYTTFQPVMESWNLPNLKA